jgi:hypothetical protein
MMHLYTTVAALHSTSPDGLVVLVFLLSSSPDNLVILVFLLQVEDLHSAPELIALAVNLTQNQR